MNDNNYSISAKKNIHSLNKTIKSIAVFCGYESSKSISVRYIKINAREYTFKEYSPSIFFLKGCMFDIGL